MLRASIDAQPESWPDRLPALLAAYRMTPHSVTGISPNMAMIGREVLLPASLGSAAGGARRSNYTFCGGISSNLAQRACVRSQRDQPRCENTEKLFRQARQGAAFRTKSVSVALLATTFDAL